LNSEARQVLETFQEVFLLVPARHIDMREKHDVHLTLLMMF